MQLINTDGMAFIGPGSEWFWTALTGLVLAVTFVAIYRQLSIARSATATEQTARFNREYGSERMTRHRLEVLDAMRSTADRANLPGVSPAAIARFWEEMGYLSRRGHLDPELMWNSGPGPDCDMWWMILAPWVRMRRAEAGPTVFENFEWYAGINAEFNRRAGAVPNDEASLASNLEFQITQCELALGFEEALRTVVVASTDAVPAAPAAASPARAAAAEG